MEQLPKQPHKRQILNQNNDTYNRLLHLRKLFEKFMLKKTKISPSAELQNALFKAAKIGNIKLMLEFISHGADPLAKDAENNDAIFYAIAVDPIKTGSMLLEIISDFMESDVIKE